MTLTADTVLVASPGQVSSELDGEVIVLNHRDGVYFGLDAGVGAFVWRQLQAPIRVQDIVDAVLQTYQVDEARCARDIGALLQELIRTGLVEATGRER